MKKFKRNLVLVRTTYDSISWFHAFEV